MTVLHVTPRVTLTALSPSLGGEVWARATAKGKACPGQVLGHRLAYQGGPETGENGAVVRGTDTFQRASGSLEKATVPGSWHMPTRWRGCPPGISGGNAPAEQCKCGGLPWALPEAPLLEPLNMGQRQMEGPLWIKVMATLRDGKNKFLGGSKGGDSAARRGNKHPD